MSDAPALHVLVVAAGRGVRAGPGGPKQYRALGGRTVLRRTLEAFAEGAPRARLRVVIHADDRALYEAAVAGLDLPDPVIGGAARQDSVRRGLEALEGAEGDVVMIHDAARPFVSKALLDRIEAALEAHEAVCPGLPVTDTVRRREPDGAAGETLDRDALSRAQTPQAFRLGPILAAHRAAEGREMTDDVAVAQAAGLCVALVEGEAANVKLTTAEDFQAAARRIGGTEAMEYRSGSGFDVHAFGVGDAAVLCGVEVPHGRGLKGHSDADVGMHALTDAIFGALAEGDIGRWFPPSEPAWKGAASRVFLEKAVERVAARGGRLVNADVTLICERPKIGPHAEAMRARLAEVLGIDAGRVSVKATTTERLGFAGREEGIAALASCSVALPEDGA
ncbi:MAG: bifunctional 2-C-methyl-D-erythritol 4-phosphate cytidylyltransferase/2-C-methyl-D-erythritol 2,4-cyclodiphosphate synthase [Pseudomonadota bacterium]